MNVNYFSVWALAIHTIPRHRPDGWKKTNKRVNNRSCGSIALVCSPFVIAGPPPMPSAGVMLALWWRDVGIAMAWCWHCDGVMLELWWRDVGTVMAWCWHCDGVILELWWRDVGTVLTWCWHCVYVMMSSNTWSSGGTALCRVGGAISQLDLPSMTPLSVAGCGWLQLGAPHWATSVITASSW